MAEEEDDNGVKVTIELDRRGSGMGRVIMPGTKPFCYVELIDGDDESLTFEATIGGGFEQGELTEVADVLEFFVGGLRGHEVEKG